MKNVNVMREFLRNIRWSRSPSKSPSKMVTAFNIGTNKLWESRESKIDFLSYVLSRDIKTTKEINASELAFLLNMNDEGVLKTTYVEYIWSRNRQRDRSQVGNNDEGI